MECFKLSRVQLYLTCKPHEHSDDVLLTSVFEPSTNYSESSTRQNKGKIWRQNITAQLENERKCGEKLKEDQDEEYKINLNVDREKREALEEEISELPSGDSLRH